MFHRANLLKLLASVLLCQLAGAIDSAFTASSLGNNGVSLKTGFQPPSWVFLLVWITLYTLRGIFLYLFCEKGLEQQKIKGELVIFGIQLGLNALWSFLFLGKNLLTTFLLRSFCSGLQSLTILKFRKISKIASDLLLPYIMWASFAMLLNCYIWILNS